MRTRHVVRESDSSSESIETPSELSDEESDEILVSNKSKLNLRSKRSDKRTKKQTNKSKPKKKSKQYVSSCSEESLTEDTDSDDNDLEVIETDSDDNMVIKRKPRKKPSNLILDSEDSGVDDKRKNSDSEDLNNEIQTNDDEIEFLEYIPASRSTIKRINFKPPENGFSSSNTMSSMEDISSSENETIEATDPIFQQISKKLTEKLKEQMSDKSPEKLVKQRTQSVGSVCDTDKTFSVKITKTIESTEVIPKPMAVAVPQIRTPIPHIRPPSPQQPTSSLQVISINTPRTKPYATTKWKQGQAIHIPAPPQMPPILSFRVMSAIDTIKAIKKRLNNDCEEIEAIDQTLKISLNCPITNKRCVLPSRSLKCHHFDCFDINAFLEINFNHKMEDWKCPKCKQPATAALLIIDSLLQHILTHKDVDSSVESVIFDRTASWVPDIKLPENSVSRSGDTNVINVLDNTLEEVIDLIDDDDEEELSALPCPTLPTAPLQASRPPVSVPNPPIVNNVNAAVAAAKFLAKDISNHLNQTNRNKTPVPNQCKESPNNYQLLTNNNEYLLLMGSTDQSVQKTNRWSTAPNVSLNPPQLIQPTVVAINRTTTAPNIANNRTTAAPNVTINRTTTAPNITFNRMTTVPNQPINRQPITFGMISNMMTQQNNQKNTGQQVVHQPQPQPQPQPQLQPQLQPQPQIQANRSQAQIQNRQQFIPIVTSQTTPQQIVINRNTASIRTPSATIVATTASNQGSGSCDFRFTLGPSGQMVVTCPACNESFCGTQGAVEAHKKSAQHIAKTSKSNATNTTNRTDTQTTGKQTNPQNNNNNNRNNINNNNKNYNSRPIAINQRPVPARTYSNQYYGSDTGFVWNGYQQQPQQFNSYDPNNVPFNFMTSNYNYPQTYVQQVVPTAHQPQAITQPPQAHTNAVYPTHQLANQNQSNFYRG